MKNHTFTFLQTICLLFCISIVNAQTAITSYTTTTTATTASTITPINGHISGGNTHIYTATNTYTAIFGTTYPAISPTTTNVTGFVAGGVTYTGIGASSTKPFTAATMMRVNNAAFTGNRFSGLFEYTSVRTGAGVANYNVAGTNNLTTYIKPTALYTMEDILNNYTLSYGADNIFSNCGTGNAGNQTGGGATIYSTGNNIERVDLIYKPGIGATTATSLTRLGFLINERGGNDSYKVAVITGVTSSGTATATSLGSVITVGTGTWGAVGPAVSTVVVMGTEGSSSGLRIKELAGMAANTAGPPVTQTVSGTFISLAALGVAVNTRVYGIAVFPGDITSNYVTLTGTPTNTTDNGVGGLDLMSGNILSRSTSNFDVLAQDLTGRIWNDANGNGMDDGVSEANVSGTNTASGGSIAAGSNLFVNIVVGGIVVAVVPVAADGTYVYHGMLPNINYTLVLSNTAGTVGSAVSPSTPAGWTSTSDNQNGTIDPLTTGQVTFISPFGGDAVPDVINQDFGIQQRPESAVNTQVIGVNPGSTVNTTVDPNWFSTSNVGANPNTQDYNGGTVDNIRITSFPTNATSLTIGTTTYYPNAGSIPGTCPTATCLVFPGGGVIVAAPGGVPASPITVDPVSGIINVVIPFTSIDNTGAEDPTPGSVTLSYTAILPVTWVGFSGIKNKSTIELNWKVLNEVSIESYIIERSSNGKDFEKIGELDYNNNGAEAVKTYTYVEDISNNTNSQIFYYRIKQYDVDGRFSYSNIISISLRNDIESYLVYPVPASENLFLKISSQHNDHIVINIVTAIGQILQSQRADITKGNNLIPVDQIEKLPKGVYTISIQHSDKVIMKKFIKL